MVPALSGPIFHDAQSCIRMNPGKQPLTYRMSKYLYDEFITMISGTQAIPMPDKKFSHDQFLRHRFSKNGNVEFICEIFEHPHVMISGKIINENIRIPQSCQTAKQSRITFWDHLSIFKPIIPDITNEIQRLH